MLSKKYMKMPAKLRSQEERIPNTTNGKVFLLIGINILINIHITKCKS